MSYKKFWITNDYFIRLDDSGRTLNENNDTLQGALGYVIKLYHKSLSESDFLKKNRESESESLSNAENASNDLKVQANERKFLALKIPKLHGETHRENAYISSLMQREVEVVEKVGFSAKPGLLKSEQMSLTILRQPISARERLDFHDRVIAVIYEEGSNPYFLKLPPDESTESKSNGNDKIKDIVKTCQKILNWEEITNKWNDTIVVYKSSSQETGWQFISQNQLAQSDSTGLAAYICLPGVIYEWIDGTLQYAIGRRKRGTWSIQDHLRLTRQICTGINALHQNGFIHADIRPSNIAYKINPGDPTDYFIIDYGSLATELSGKQAGRGDTVIQPVVVEGERASPFYSRERIRGWERESADRARFIVTGTQVGYLILGWHNDGPEMEQLDENSVLDFYNNGHALKGDSTLGPGDQVQIQNYVFVLRDNEKISENGKYHILPCDQAVSTVVGNRIVLSPNQGGKLPDSLYVDRVIERQQWSAATDLYSLGVLLLYSVFMDTSNDESIKDISYSKKTATEVSNFDPTTGDVGLEKQKPDNLQTLVESQKQAEDKFVQMLDYLSKPKYFETVWEDLESLCIQIEELLRKGKSDIASRLFRTNPDDISNNNNTNVSQSNKKILDRTIEVTLRISQTAPYSRRLLAGLDWNPVAFVFITHFAMACIHRHSHFEDRRRNAWNREEILKLNGESVKGENMKVPFCDDRREKPGPDGPAKKALDRLDRLIDIMSDQTIKTTFSEFMNIPNIQGRIKPYEPESEFRAMAYREAIESFKQRNKAMKKLSKWQLTPYVKEMISELIGIDTSSSQNSG